MNLAVYDLTSGEISRCVTCPEDLAELQAGEGEGWVEIEQPVPTHLWRVDPQTLTLEPLPEPA